MKKLAILISLFLLSIGTLISQSTEETIKEIRADYENVRMNLETYDSTYVDVFDESTEGGQVTGYYHNGSLKFMKVWMFGETGKRKIEYYFFNEVLSFVFDTRYQYNRPIYWDKERAKENNDSDTFDTAKTSIQEDRYYFENSRLIRWITPSGRQGDSKLAYYQNLEKEIPEYANKWKDKLKK